MMSFLDVLCTLRRIRRVNPRDAAELKLYATDDLRRIYQREDTEPIRLRDGNVTRAELVAVIRWRVFLAGLVNALVLVAAAASVVAAIEGWH